MKVSWTETKFYLLSYGDNTPYIGKKTYQGEVVQQYNSFFGTPKLVVKCDDGKIRKVRTSKCIIL